MNRILKHTLAAAGLGVALMGPGMGYAQPDEPRHPPQRMMERMADRLDLSDAQRTEVREIFASGKEQGETDRKRLHELRTQLRESQGDFDAGSVQAAADEVGQITSRMTYRMAESQHRIREVLTPEQREKLDAYMAKRGDHRGGHRGKGRRGEGPGSEED